MASFAPRLDILPENQRALWPELAPASGLGFVLYGGTAVALRLGHRQSVDFDFFSSRELDRPLLIKAMPFLQEAETIQDAAGTYAVLSRTGVKVSFFGGLPFGRSRDPDWTADRVLRVAALDDLMATKLKVILQRTETKDFRDIVALADHGVPVERGLAIAEQFYRPQFSPVIAVKALTYFEAGDVPDLTARERTRLIELASGVRKLPAVQILPGLAGDDPPGGRYRTGASV